MLRWLAIASMISALLPTPARAGGGIQYREWLNQCLPGSSACISWSMRLEYDAALQAGRGGTRVALTVANHQGSQGYGSEPAAAIATLFWEGLTWEPWEGWPFSVYHQSQFAATMHGNAGQTRPSEYPVLTPVSTVSWESSVRDPGVGTARMGAFGTLLENYMIWGCDAAPEWLFPSFNDYPFYATCGGSMTLEWNVGGRLEFTDETRAAMTLFTNASHPTYGCTANVDCVTVPEPNTLLLLASGLLGLAYVRRRRVTA